MELIYLHIKNMVCPRCIMVVENELLSLGAKVLDIKLGYVMTSLPSGVAVHMVDKRLRPLGFELLGNQEDIVVNQIKSSIRSYVEFLESAEPEITLSEFLVRDIPKNYNYLSQLFSKRQSQTIESYFIQLRIEKG